MAQGAVAQLGAWDGVLWGGRCSLGAVWGRMTAAIVSIKHLILQVKSFDLALLAFFFQGRDGASGAPVHLRMNHPSVRPLDAIGAALVVLCLSWGFNQVAVKLALPDIRR